MEKLYVEIDNQRIPISEEIVNKYKLKKGMYTPYTKVGLLTKTVIFRCRRQRIKRKPELNEDEVILTTRI